MTTAGAQFGSNITHTSKRTAWAYDGPSVTCLGSSIARAFDVYASNSSSPWGTWGSNLFRLELWGGDYNFTRSYMLWSSTGPWSVEPERFHVDSSAVRYDFRLTILPEPSSFTALVLPIGWVIITHRPSPAALFNIKNQKLRILPSLTSNLFRRIVEAVY